LLIRSHSTKAAPAVKDFLCFFSPVLRTRNFSQFIHPEAAVKVFFRLSLDAFGLGFAKSAGRRLS